MADLEKLEGSVLNRSVVTGGLVDVISSKIDRHFLFFGDKNCTFVAQ